MNIEVKVILHNYCKRQTNRKSWPELIIKAELKVSQDCSLCLLKTTCVCIFMVCVLCDTKISLKAVITLTLKYGIKHVSLSVQFCLTSCDMPISINHGSPSHNVVPGSHLCSCYDAICLSHLGTYRTDSFYLLSEPVIKFLHFISHYNIHKKSGHLPNSFINLQFSSASQTTPFHYVLCPDKLHVYCHQVIPVLYLQPSLPISIPGQT